MKKLMLLALTALMVMGCVNDGKVDRSDFAIVEMDSCEYIVWTGVYGFEHHGNCRFCKERRQKELEELVIKLKEK